MKERQWSSLVEDCFPTRCWRRSESQKIKIKICLHLRVFLCCVWYPFCFLIFDFIFMWMLVYLCLISLWLVFLLLYYIIYIFDFDFQVRKFPWEYQKVICAKMPPYQERLLLVLKVWFLFIYLLLFLNIHI